MLLSPCGIDCEACEYFKSCGGCHKVKGNPFYLKDFGVEICPLHDCPINKKSYKSCAEYAELPCQIFYDWKDPSMTEEAHLKSIDDRVKILKDSLK